MNRHGVLLRGEYVPCGSIAEATVVLKNVRVPASAVLPVNLDLPRYLRLLLSTLNVHGRLVLLEGTCGGVTSPVLVSSEAAVVQLDVRIAPCPIRPIEERFPLNRSKQRETVAAMHFIY